MRESDVIVLMVSPLLALRFVIDHNTEQRMEFPRLFHHDRAWIRYQPGILEIRRANCREIANRRKSRCILRTGVDGRRAHPFPMTSLAKAAFFVFLVPQFGFWPLRPLRA
jgi:hypothetical protein